MDRDVAVSAQQVAQALVQTAAVDVGRRVDAGRNPKDLLQL